MYKLFVDFNRKYDVNLIFLYERMWTVLSSNSNSVSQYSLVEIQSYNKRRYIYICKADYPYRERERARVCEREIER